MSVPPLRYADAATAERYPFPVAGPAPWRREDGVWRLSLALPELAAGTILVPSLALREPEDAAATGSSRYRWTLAADGGAWSLQEVPSSTPAPQPPAGSPVTTHIDCYHLHRRLRAPRLELYLHAPVAPQRYLVAVSARALTLAAPPLPAGCAALACPPAPRSQLAAPVAMAQRICSPTCVSMVLDLWQRPHDWLALAGECHDPVTNLYGIWPLALQAAARRGCIGAVEVFADWQAPLAALAGGVPLVTSIRFSGGELPGAPLDATGGHLVVVHGAGPDRIRVCDPAAPEDAVDRSYPADAFSGAWLRHRGAAYILPP
jgi:hypothetical protein